MEINWYTRSTRLDKIFFFGFPGLSPQYLQLESQPPPLSSITQTHSVESGTIDVGGWVFINAHVRNDVVDVVVLVIDVSLWMTDWIQAFHATFHLARAAAFSAGFRAL